MTANGNKSAIACIGWGSLIWDPRKLPVRGDWYTDGPLLPVEFARESSDKRITLVICPALQSVRTLWCHLTVQDLETAKYALARREYDKATPAWIKANIGYWNRERDMHGMEAGAIADWAKDRGFAGVVWTNLPCKFNSTSGVFPSEDDVLCHLKALRGKERSDAETYVRKVPPQIDTPYRRRITQELGWTYTP